MRGARGRTGTAASDGHTEHAAGGEHEHHPDPFHAARGGAVARILSARRALACLAVEVVAGTVVRLLRSPVPSPLTGWSVAAGLLSVVGLVLARALPRLAR